MNDRRMLLKRLVVILLILCAVSVALSESPESIIDSAYILGNDRNIHIRMDMIISAGNGTKERKVEVYIKRTQKTTKTYLHIVSPAFLNKMKFLVHRNENGDETKWIKTSRGVRRLSLANSSERVFGSDFTVEDFSAMQTEEFTLRMLQPITINGEECYAIEAVPLKRNSYSRKIIMVGMRTRLLREVDFFDEEGRKVKQYTLLSTQNIHGKKYPLLCKMENFEENTSTTLNLKQVDVTRTLEDRIFNKGNL